MPWFKYSHLHISYCRIYLKSVICFKRFWLQAAQVQRDYGCIRYSVWSPVFRGLFKLKLFRWYCFTVEFIVVFVFQPFLERLLCGFSAQTVTGECGCRIGSTTTSAIRTLLPLSVWSAPTSPAGCLLLKADVTTSRNKSSTNDGSREVILCNLQKVLTPLFKLCYSFKF